MSTAESNLLESKNEIRVIKLSLGRIYKLLTGIIKQISTSEGNNLQFTQQSGGFLTTEKGISKYQNETDSILAQGELDIIDEINKSVTSLGEFIINYNKTLASNKELFIIKDGLTRQIDNLTIRLKKAEEDSSLIKIKASNIEQKSKTNVSQIMKALHSSHNTSGSIVDKSPIYALYECIIIHIRKLNVDRGFLNFLQSVEKADSTVEIQKLQEIMKDAEKGYNELLLRSKSYVLVDEIRRIVDSTHHFSTESVEILLKNLFAFKTQAQDEVIIRLPIVEFNKLIDHVASRADKYWEDIDRLMQTTKENFSKVDSCFDILIKETSVDVKNVTELINAIKSTKD